MSKKQNLASFCRLCLVKTTNKVPVFGSEQENVTNLLALIELDINPDLEFNAVVCYECILTLEGFFQFKEKCHKNDEFLKTIPPKDGCVLSEISDDEAAMECEYLLEEVEQDSDDRNSEERGLVKEVDAGISHKKTKNKSSKKNTPITKEPKPAKVSKKPRVRKPRPPSPLTVTKKVFIPNFPGPQPTEDDLPKLLDSYPEYLHFERRKRTLYFDLVYYGERYNSAIFTSNYTYWQCAERRRGNCPAQVFVTNDYTEFERRYEHCHVYKNRKRKKRKEKPDVLTPRQALPAVFRICWYRVQQKRARQEELKKIKMEIKSEETDEVGDSQTEKISLDELIEYDDAPINPESESNAAVCTDCIVILEEFCQFKEKCHENDVYLKTQPPEDNAEDSKASEEEYEDLEMECDYLEEDDIHEPQNGEEQSPVKDVPSNEPALIANKNVELTPVTDALKSPTKIVTKRKIDVADPLDVCGQVKIVRKQMAKPLSSSCKDLPVLKAPVNKYLLLPKFTGPQPSDDELPKLQDSYPDCFHFEKTSRSLYFDMSYYGERFNSAIYGANYTYWQCADRKRFRCPALVHVKNDYTHFERRFEHTHGEIKRKMKPDILTPRQALPAIFRICWNKVNEKKTMKENLRKFKNNSMNDEDWLGKKSWLVKSEDPAPDSDDDDY